jgi:lysophospholipase L1-like esterase
MAKKFLKKNKYTLHSKFLKMNKFFQIVIGFIFLVSFKGLHAQQHPPFYDEIQNFKHLDSADFPAKNAILFVGSSSIRKWQDIQSYFPGKTVINRGFGGSELTDAIRYADDIIIPYHPKQIVIYSGENDLAYSDSITPAIVLNRFARLFEIIRSAMPTVPIVYISIKPSPSRARLMPQMVKANNLIKQFLKTKKKTVFIDVYHKMLNKDGTPNKDIFSPDNLHMNAKGYQIWQRAIAPYLVKT